MRPCSRNPSILWRTKRPLRPGWKKPWLKFKKPGALSLWAPSTMAPSRPPWLICWIIFHQLCAIATNQCLLWHTPWVSGIPFRHKKWFGYFVGYSTVAVVENRLEWKMGAKLSACRLLYLKKPPTSKSALYAQNMHFFIRDAMKFWHVMSFIMHFFSLSNPINDFLVNEASKAFLWVCFQNCVVVIDFWEEMKNFQVSQDCLWSFKAFQKVTSFCLMTLILIHCEKQRVFNIL